MTTFEALEEEGGSTPLELTREYAMKWLGSYLFEHLGEHFFQGAEVRSLEEAEEILATREEQAVYWEAWVRKMEARTPEEWEEDHRAFLKVMERRVVNCQKHLPQAQERDSKLEGVRLQLWAWMPPEAYISFRGHLLDRLGREQPEAARQRAQEEEAREGLKLSLEAFQELELARARAKLELLRGEAAAWGRQLELAREWVAGLEAALATPRTF